MNAINPTSEPTHAEGSLLVDDGLQCPDCDYNLTGIDSPRCPECGSELDWPVIGDQAEADRRRIAPLWERVSWAWMPLAFVVTTLETALLPWRFAQRIGSKHRIWPALGFYLTCQIIGISKVLYSGVDWASITLWLAGVFCSILLQVVILGWIMRLHRVDRSHRFWLVVSAYTSYPLMTVGNNAPPFILYEHSNIWPFPLGDPFWGSRNYSELMTTFIFYLWACGLVTVAYHRLPSRYRWRSLWLLLLIPLMTCVSSYLGWMVGTVLDQF